MNEVKSKPSLKDVLMFDFHGALVKRYHTAPQLQVNTDGHHQRGVAVLCKYLWPYAEEPRAQLLLAALFHDQAEQITSDVSAPAKRMLGLSKLLHDVEQGVLRDYGLAYEDELTDEEARILKLADVLDGALWQIHEYKLGNKYAGLIYGRFLSYAPTLLVSDRDTEVFNAVNELWKEANER